MKYADSSTRSEGIFNFRFLNQSFREKRSFWEYIRDEDASPGRRALLTDLLCFFMLTPLVLISSFVCALSAIHLFNESIGTRADMNGLRKEIAIGGFLALRLCRYAYVKVIN